MEFRPEAEADLLNARDWYEEQQPGLGEVFSVAVESAVKVIHGDRVPNDVNVKLELVTKDTVK